MFRKKKKQEPLPDFSDVEVKLKPWGPVSPGTYLTIIYGIIILIIIFVIFFLPGILAQGIYYNFETTPLKAGVWIDAKKVGITPCEILVTRGKRKIEIKRPFYKTISIEEDVGSFIFSLPFLPPRERKLYSLEIEKPDELLEWTLTDFSQWAMIKEFSSSYPLPKILSEAAYSIYTRPEESYIEQLQYFIKSAAPYVHSKFLARDFIYALTIIESKGALFSQATLIRLIKKFIAFEKDHDNIYLWIYFFAPLNPTTREQKLEKKFIKSYLEAEAWFGSKLDQDISYLSSFNIKRGVSHKAPLYINGLSFLYIPEGLFLMGKSDEITKKDILNNLELLPHPLKVKPFYISKTEVSNRQFKAFLDENPFWLPSNRDKLLEQELISQEYLDDWQDNTYPQAMADYPLVNVSYYAAEAYCKWLTTKLKNILPNFIARLPYEGEWEWAAAGDQNFTTTNSVFFKNDIQGPAPVGSGAGNTFGLNDMAGNVWEWCSDWFAPASYLLTSTHAQKNQVITKDKMPYGFLKVVRGGSWANDKDLVKLYTRGSQPPDWCSPYLGFRVVLDEK